MKVAVRFRYEDGGRPVGKWREAFEHALVTRGDLILEAAFVRELNSHMNVATLRSEDGIQHTLLRAEVLYMKEEFLTITGLEHDMLYNKYSAQTWHVEILTPR